MILREVGSKPPAGAKAVDIRSAIMSKRYSITPLQTPISTPFLLRHTSLHLTLSPSIHPPAVSYSPEEDPPPHRRK